MVDINDFKTVHKLSRQLGKFSEIELNFLKNKVPDELINFLNQEGRCTYSEDFFWTVNFKDVNFQEIYNQWGLPGKECYTFIRTATGVCIYYYKNNYYYLNPLLGVNCNLNNNIGIVLNIYLTMDAFIVDAFGFDVYKKQKKSTELKNDEMYAFVPALPLGGSFESSKLEKVKMFEHLLFLAQLFDNKVSQI